MREQSLTIWSASCYLKLHVRPGLGNSDSEEVGLFRLRAGSFYDPVVTFGTRFCLRPGPCEPALSRGRPSDCGPIQCAAGTLWWHPRATRISFCSGSELLAQRPEPRSGNCPDLVLRELVQHRPLYGGCSAVGIAFGGRR